MPEVRRRSPILGGWHHGILVKYCPHASKIDSRLVIPSSSRTRLLKLISRSSQLALRAETYRATMVPSPALSMCSRSVRSRTTSLAGRIKSFTCSLKLAVRPAVSLPLHRTTVARPGCRLSAPSQGPVLTVDSLTTRLLWLDEWNRRGQLQVYDQAEAPVNLKEERRLLGRHNLFEIRDVLQP